MSKKNRTGDELVDFCLKSIQSIKSEMETISTSRKNAMKFYRGDEDVVKVIEGRSKATTTDVMDAIEWIKPSLLEIFTSGNEVVSFAPVTKEDVRPSELLSLLTNHQVRVKNKWFLIMYDWLDDALKLKTGALKYQWYKNVETFEKEYEELSDIELQAKMAEPNVEILSQTPIVKQEAQIDPMSGMEVSPALMAYNVKVRYTIEDEYPKIEAVPAENIGYPQKSKEIDDVEFFYEMYQMSNATFKREYGEDVADRLGSVSDEDDVYRERFKDLGGRNFYYDTERKEFTCYECFYQDPDNGEPYIVKICGKEIISEPIPNQYKKPPYKVITPFKMAHRITGMSIYDLLREIMMIRTALLRQILDNVYFSNNCRYFGDPNRVNLDDFFNNNKPMAFIRTVGAPAGAVIPEEKAPIAPEVFQFWEMLNVEKDYHSGVPRSFQGVNKAQLSKTWRGAAQQVQQAAQRIAMMARLIAEMGVAPLMDEIAKMNMQFLKKSTSVRYLGEFLEIPPDNIIGKYDIVVNVGTGTGDKAETIGFIQQLLGLYAQVFKTGIPIVNSQNVYNAFKELIKAMNYKNIDDFITQPKIGESLIALLQTLIGMGAMNIPQVAQQIMQVATAFGVAPQVMQAVSGATHEGQKTPEQPQQPSQPFNPAVEPMGGGNFG
jgi:hypothetical protein